MTPADSTATHTHTPGPWSVEQQWAHDTNGDPFRFAHWISDPLGVDLASSIIEPADARLIAAAPDLLATCLELRQALAALMRCIDDETADVWIIELARIGIPNGFGCRAQAAIAKAEGR